MKEHENTAAVRQNPFSISFGSKPKQYVERLVQTEDILSDFRQNDPASSTYMITGVRGSGKTVFMTTIANALAEDGWIVIDLNPKVDMRKSLVSSLYSQPLMKTHFLKAKIDLSLFGMGMTIEESSPISDYDVALDRMFSVIKKRGEKVLITIDEASNTNEMQVFVSSFQILTRKAYPVCLLMTGLYENLYDLQNEPNLTFLYRAPKIVLSPLNTGMMKQRYMDALEVSSEEAGDMARTVMGYPYGFQVLGYLYFKESPKSYKDVLPLFDQYMSEYVYSKIWSELSKKDKETLHAAIKSETGKVKEIRESINMPLTSFSVYRDRLIKKGLLQPDTHGQIHLALPRLKEFIESQIEE